MGFQQLVLHQSVMANPERPGTPQVKPPPAFHHRPSYSRAKSSPNVRSQQHPLSNHLMQETLHLPLSEDSKRQIGQKLQSLRYQISINRNPSTVRGGNVWSEKTSTAYEDAERKLRRLADAMRNLRLNHQACLAHECGLRDCWVQGKEPSSWQGPGRWECKGGCTVGTPWGPRDPSRVAAKRKKGSRRFRDGESGNAYHPESASATPNSSVYALTDGCASSYSASQDNASAESTKLLWQRIADLEALARRYKEHRVYHFNKMNQANDKQAKEMETWSEKVEAKDKEIQMLEDSVFEKQALIQRKNALLKDKDEKMTEMAGKMQDACEDEEH
ncbi:hypothetical protein K431DRAFT_313452 [Polychaeton citri CBS 116435]|uniref:Uncharacterized protein n=1 Tax=Polychaeton citri CBS 116435 TaxID=1314669 RepID=A0A9P4Q893_9PEZI|nr:hypothetical protein K431DRAFT_313452 [Polychaeton citri CBS 116435]